MTPTSRTSPSNPFGLPEPTEVRSKRHGATVTSLCDHKAVADEAVATFRTDGLNLDFSTASLATLDILLAEQFGARGIDPTTPQWKPNEAHRRSIILIGSYLGEVIRVRFGGEWKDDPQHMGKPLFVVLSLGRHGRILPLERAYRRMKDGNSSPLLGVIAEIESNVPRHGDHSDAMAWVGQAADFMRRDRLDVAQRFLDTALRIEPHLAEAWLCSGMIAERVGKRTEAEYSYQQALKRVHPEDQELSQLVRYRARALAQSIANEKQEDRPTIESLDPEVVITQEWATDDFPLVGSGAKNAVSESPTPRNGGARAGSGLAPAPRTTGAQSADADALVHDAWQLAFQGRLDEAAFCFRHAIAASDERNSRLGLAALYIALGRPAEAITVVEALTAKFDPDASLLKARALATMQEFRQALDWLHSLPTRVRARLEVRTAIAQNLLALGRTVDARDAYSALLRANPLQHEAWLGISAAAQQQGDATAAASAFTAFTNLTHPVVGTANERGQQSLSQRAERDAPGRGSGTYRAPRS